MTRYIVILTLALTAGLSSGNASAQQANDDSPRVEINGFTSVPYPENFQAHRNTNDGFLQCMDLWFALVDVEINSFTSVPYTENFQAHRNTNDGFLQCMDLWFALVDSGYTEAEAFEMMTLEIRDSSDEAYILYSW